MNQYQPLNLDEPDGPWNPWGPTQTNTLHSDFCSQTMSPDTTYLAQWRAVNYHVQWRSIWRAVCIGVVNVRTNIHFGYGLWYPHVQSPKLRITWNGFISQRKVIKRIQMGSVHLCNFWCNFCAVFSLFFSFWNPQNSQDDLQDWNEGSIILSSTNDFLGTKMSPTMLATLPRRLSG